MAKGIEERKIGGQVDEGRWEYQSKGDDLLVLLEISSSIYIVGSGRKELKHTLRVVGKRGKRAGVLSSSVRPLTSRKELSVWLEKISRRIRS